MTVLVSVGLATRVLGDWHLDWQRALSAAGPFALSFFLFHGWVLPQVKQSGEERDDRSFKYEIGTRTDRIVYWWWSVGIGVAVMMLSFGLCELFDLNGRQDRPSAVFSALAPAILLGIHGFPHVLGRVRQSAANGQAPD